MVFRSLRSAMAGVMLLLFLALLAVGCGQQGGSYPQRPVELYVLDPAGGATDIVARALADGAQAELGQPLVVVNKPGGAGTIAASEMIKAPADGYTIALEAVGPMALQPHRTELPYKTVDDYATVINLVRQPLVMAVGAKTPYQSLGELLDAAKAKPESIKMGLPGTGTIAEINLDLLDEQAGVRFQRVRLNNAPEALRALLAGDVDGVIIGPPVLISPVKAGTARVLGTFEAERNPNFPEAPAFRELGIDITLGGYFFIIAPKGTPESVLFKLHSVFKKVSEQEKFRDLMSKSGMVMDYQNGLQLRDRLKADYDMFGRLVKH